MTNKKNNIRKHTNSIAAEPDISYNSMPKQVSVQNTIIISTLEEQEEANYHYWLNLSPEKRFKLHYMLITHFFKDELKKNKNINNNKIIFTE